MKLDQYKPKQNLNKKIWQSEDKLREDVKNALLKIANDFIDDLDLDIRYDDIVFTGSLANYNYNIYSDIDLHIIISGPKKNVDEDIFEAFLAAKKKIWNDDHDIKIKGYEVEIYPELDPEAHSSSGVYSLQNDEWIEKPDVFDAEPNLKAVSKKLRSVEKLIDSVVEKNATEKEIEKTINKLKKMRQTGLNASGEMSVENIVYKILRNEGTLQKLFDELQVAYDRELSLD